jgi:FAD synthase
MFKNKNYNIGRVILMDETKEKGTITVEELMLNVTTLTVVSIMAGNDFLFTGEAWKMMDEADETILDKEVQKISVTGGALLVNVE